MKKHLWDTYINAYTKKDLIILAVLFVAYIAAGKIGLSFASVNPSSSAIWPPTGIAIAALILFGYRFWPAIFLGSFFLNLGTQGTLLTSLSIATGNTLEPLVGTYFTNTFSNRTKKF